MRALYRFSPLVALLFLSGAAVLIEMLRAYMCQNDKTPDKACDELFSAASFVICALAVGVSCLALLAPQMFGSGGSRGASASYGGGGYDY